VAKNVRDKEPVIEILVGSVGCHWKLTHRLKGMLCWRLKSETFSCFVTNTSSCWRVKLPAAMWQIQAAGGELLLVYRPRHPCISYIRLLVVNKIVAE